MAFGTYQNTTEFWSALEAWHRGLDDNRGQRAELRRAKSPIEILCSPAFQRGFGGYMAASGFALNQAEMERLAPAIGLLSHVNEPFRQSHFAKQLAPTNKSDQKVHDLRFKKLMAVDDMGELYLMLLRLVRYLDGSAHVKSLVLGVFYWGEKTKRAWAMSYYTA